MLAHFPWSKETSDGSFPAAKSYALTIRMFWTGGGSISVSGFGPGDPNLGGSKFARKPVLTVGISGLRENFSRDRGIKEPFWEPKPSMEASVFENAPSKENKFLFD